MLVSLAITLIMMGAVTSLFQLVTDSVAGSRAGIEMSERLRACRNRLQADLQGVTVGTMQPPLRPENDEGYFEYIEGPYIDNDWLRAGFLATPTSPTILGDADDVLMFTVRSRGEPFVGKFNTTTTESQVAEVMYFAVPNGPIVDATTTPVTRLYTLYRRVLLVSPGLRSVMPSPTANYYDLYDVSARYDNSSGTPLMIPNTLGDLTKRENRFAHYPGASTSGFPYDLNYAISGAGTRPSNNNAYLVPLSTITITMPRLGDDVLMTNVLAFDVQVFDPNAPVQVGTVAVGPPDYGYAPATAGTTFGAFVDLGYPYSGSSGKPLFSR